jgi:rhodanese-related sulfurtransferase
MVLVYPRGYKKGIEMNRTVKIFSGMALMVSMLFATTACSTTEAIDMNTVTSVIDVRTPEEYNAGHLEGALLIPVEVGDFVGSISELDREGNYIIYCRTGRRADVAIQQMTELGFKNMTNLGSLENAAAVTQIPVVD